MLHNKTAKIAQKRPQFLFVVKATTLKQQITKFYCKFEAQTFMTGR